MKFSYKFRGDNLYPIIEIILERGKTKIRLDALVDSGATISIFQGSIAEYLGINIETGERRIFQGVGGRIVGYIHKVSLQICEIRFPCNIAFSNELVTSLNILGRTDFFEQFQITFDEKNKELRFTKAD